MYASADQPGPLRTRSPGRVATSAARRHRVVPTAAAWLEPAAAIAIELPCSVAPDLFFAERPEEIQQARALCQQCPARGPCLDGALQRAEPWGVWGGELILYGAIVATKRARGRPRRLQAHSGLPEATPARGYSQRVVFDQSDQAR